MAMFINDNVMKIQWNPIIIPLRSPQIPKKPFKIPSNIQLDCQSCQCFMATTLQIKGPDNPTRQLLWIKNTKCCSWDGEGRKDKGGGGGPRSKTKLCVTKLYVKAGVWLRKIVCVWQSGVCKMVCAKVVCERGRVTKLCGKDGVWQSGVWKMVWRKMVCVTKLC